MAGGFYVASRAGVPGRPEMWQRYRAAGVPIISSWIDAPRNDDIPCFQTLWKRIHAELESCAAVVLYYKNGDSDLRGALIEVGIALALQKPVRVVLEGLALREGPGTGRYGPLGSWVEHPLVTVYDTLEEAFTDVATD